MFLRGAIRSGTKGRRTAIFAATTVALLSVPAIMYSFGANPPLGHTGAPGEGTCQSCHGSLGTSTTALTVNAPTTYTPGGSAVSMTVSIPGGRGFEATVLTTPGNAPAGSFTAGTNVGVSGQYVFSSAEGTSWTISWTPPATNVGNVVLYITGGLDSTSYANTYTMMPAVVTPPTPTLGVTPTTINATVNGAEPADQPVMVTSSGASVTVTGTVSTTSCGNNWLTVMNPSGPTPLNATVHFVATGLSAGTTCTGSVSFAATGVSNSPLMVSVTLNVVTPIPPAVPTLVLSASTTTGLTFTATAGGTAPAAQSVSVTASDSSAVTFNAAPTSTGNWLTVGGSTGTATGTTPASESIGVVTTGLAAGTYSGHVTFTSSAVSNSPVTLPVTLTVNSSTPPPPTTGETFSLVVVDRQTSSNGGGDWLLLNGSGSVNSSGTPSGSGFFTRFRSTTTRSGGERSPTTTTTTMIVSSGTWKPTSMTSFTPISGSSTGGTMVLQVQITTNGVTTPSTGTLTITSTGSKAGVRLAIAGGATFDTPPDNPPGQIGTESIRQGSSGGGGGGGTPDE